jgi:hypothetical protein
MKSTGSKIIAVMTLVFAGAASAAEPVSAPQAQTPAPAKQSRPATPPVTEPAITNSATRQPSNGKQPAAARAPNDRLNLDTTTVTGNRELPKVLYIVPWKKADLGDLPAQPFNTLLDEVLTPVDRDVFRREVTYYDAMSSGGNEPGAAPAPPPGPSEK